MIVAAAAVGGGLGQIHGARRAAQRLGKDLAFVNPDLDADAAVSGGSLGKAVVDVGPEGLQGDSTLVVHLGAGDLGAAETTAALDLDAAGTHSHGAADGVLHGAAEADALLQLLGDVLCHELSVGIGGTDFDDGQRHRLADQLFHFEAETLDLLSTLADDHAGSGAVDIDANLRRITLDLNGGDTGGIKGLLEILADAIIFDDQVADFVRTGIPSGIPVLNDAYAQSMRINFLSHNSASFPYSFSATTMVMWLVRLLMRYIRPCALGIPRFRMGPAPA